MQMTTDTAVRVTRTVIQEKSNIPLLVPDCTNVLT